MQNEPYLILSHRGGWYAVEAQAVLEVIWIPELIPAEEFPTYIKGLFNLRGKIIPVVDLDLRFGRAPSPYCLWDVVVVVMVENAMVGLIVNEALAVENLDTEDISSPSAALAGGQRQPKLVKGEAKLDGKIVMVLNLGSLAQSVEYPEAGAVAEKGLAVSARPGAVEAVTPENLAVFRERARSLQQDIVEPLQIGLTPYAVIGLAGEGYAVDLNLILEFTNLKSLMPVPCCPPHVIGNMNQRGDILTIIDIRGFLGLQAPPAGLDTKVMVVKAGELNVGVIVDEARDVVYLRPSETLPAPMGREAGQEEYLTGVFQIKEGMVLIIDLEKMLEKGDLVVNETV
ncbi:MAG: chemotaxis protein CheW [Nitrospinae bacterium]|nr:chemotaxis protein CheW [Nitrospinota bacterium]